MFGRNSWIYPVVFASLLAAHVLKAEQPYGLEQRAPIGPFLNERLPSIALMQTGAWIVAEAFPHLPVDDATTLIPEPGTNRLYVSTRQGQIFWFVNDPATSNKVEFLNLTNVTQGWDDCGLLAFAFHPEFGRRESPNRGYFYVWYHYSPDPIVGPKRPSVNTPGYNRLSRFTVPDGSLVADRNSEQVLINELDRNLWHDGSGMLFGPDGFLYVAVSDEGSAFDYFQRSQTISRGLFSGVLRIDVNRDPVRSHPIRRQPERAERLPEGWKEDNYTANYFIPNDNPFQDPQGGVLEEFWAVGLRNPHRMTLDRATGRIWVGDIGQNLWEEIDIIERGGNYQWVYMEGFHTVTNKTKPPAEKFLGHERPPIFDYAHGSEGKCIIGGYVYRGAEFAKELGGQYIFGDNGSGRLWALAWDGTNRPVVTYLCNMPPGANYTGLSSFGIDEKDELYMCKMGRPSKLYKLERADKVPRPISLTFKAPDRLSRVGAFLDLTNLTVADGIIPYDVNSPLWSDGALKRRWIAVPNDGLPYGRAERIGFSSSNEWSFPEGTVFIKHFELPDSSAKGGVRRLETRFLVRDSNGGVYGLSYKWRPNNSDADLVLTGETESVTTVSDGGARTQNWFFPGPVDCLVCHTPNAGHVLGVSARQLNRPFRYEPGGVSDNQLRTWNHLGLFNRALTEATLTNLPALVRIDDRRAPIEHRVRSYLDANCAQCHRPNGVPGYFDARFSTPLALQGLINGAVANSLESPDTRVVSPGNPAKSILHLRANMVGGLQMPPLAKNVVDTNAVAVLAEWINSLPRTAVRPAKPE